MWCLTCSCCPSLQLHCSFTFQSNLLLRKVCSKSIFYRMLLQDETRVIWRWCNVASLIWLRHVVLPYVLADHINLSLAISMICRMTISSQLHQTASSKNTNASMSVWRPYHSYDCTLLINFRKELLQVCFTTPYRCISCMHVYCQCHEHPAKQLECFGLHAHTIDNTHAQIFYTNIT